MPKDPKGDALHLALASYHRCQFLLTWNCAHLANANKQEHIRHVNALLGLHVPVLTTPLELTRARYPCADCSLPLSRVKVREPDPERAVGAALSQVAATVEARRRVALVAGWPGRQQQPGLPMTHGVPEEAARYQIPPRALAKPSPGSRASVSVLRGGAARARARRSLLQP